MKPLLLTALLSLLAVPALAAQEIGKYHESTAQGKIIAK
jgi:hypothetical protein